MIKVTRDKRSAAPLSGGEANTASNVGAAGVGPFKQKSAADLEFKNINVVTNGGLAITDDTGNDEVDLSLDIHSLGTVLPTTSDYLAFSDESASGDPTQRHTIAQCAQAALVGILTTRGDLLTHFNGVAIRAAVGTNGQVLVADSAAAHGFKWATRLDSCHWQIPEPTADDDGLVAHEFPQAATIKSVIHQVSGGTNVVFNLEIRDSPFDASPTDVWSADKTATTSEATESSFDNAAIAAHDFLALNITSVSGSVDDFIVAVEYEVDA